MIQLPKLSLSAFSKQAINIINKYYNFSDLKDILSSCSEKVDDKVSPVDLSPLPIEDFRNPALRPILTSVARCFRSSGTTESDRSVSEYSELGLELYQFSALLGFSQMLKRESISNPRLVSIIPSVEEWPESSLAQMLGWFAELWDFSLIRAEEFEKFVNQPSDQPTVFFTTGFQLVHLLDSTSKLQIPRDWYVLETGGTKGKSRNVSKEELYNQLHDQWGLQLTQILSEYGMAELACQAYYSGTERQFFRFTPPVQVFVQTGLNTFASKGVGNLVVYDPLRIDVPFAIRTQDVCQLQDSGEFRILGRAETSPLKGCSLKFEDVIEDSLGDTKVRLSTELRTIAVKSSEINQLIERFRQYYTSPVTRKLLAEEFDSGFLADLALKDLHRSVVETEGGFETSLRRAVREEAVPKHWIVIPPSTHSIAAFYPCVFLIALGCKVQLRLPSNPYVSKSLFHFVEFMRSNKEVHLETLSSDWRINNINSEGQAIFLFASNATIDHMRPLAKNRMAAFGSTFSFSVIQSESDIDLALQDLFSLRRLGCLSARSLFVHDSISLELLSERTKNWMESAEIRPSDLERAGMFSDSLRMSRKGWSIHDNQHLCFANRELNTTQMSEAVALSKFVIPIISYHNQIDLESWVVRECGNMPRYHFVFAGIEQTQNFRLPTNMELRKIGTLNSFPWNGLHCSKPLLKINT